jgi:hypothetical protein
MVSVTVRAVWAERHREEIQTSRLRFDLGRDGEDAAA